MREQRERQEKRQARGARNGKAANQAKILLDRQKERSDQSMGKLHRLQADAKIELAQRVRHAAAQVADDVQIHLHTPLTAGGTQRQVVMLDTVALPFVPPPLQISSLQVTGQQRIGLSGPNGSGKSTLLKVIAGRISPLSGERKVTSRVAYLDQRLDDLDAKRSAIAQLQDVNHTLSEGELRMRLAQLGLDARKAAAPTDALSGGERLKAALACVIYADEPPQLLLLDEPSNHLDLPSLAALEALLTTYNGALLVASHDQTFLNQLRLTDVLYAGSNGWEMKQSEEISQ